MRSAAKAVSAAISRIWPWLLAAALLAAAAFLLRRRRKGYEAPRRPGGSDDPREKAYELFERMTSLLAGVGMPRLLSQTPTEYAVEVDHRMEFSLAQNASALFNRLRFARVPCADELAELQSAVDDIDSAIRRRHQVD